MRLYIALATTLLGCAAASPAGAPSSSPQSAVDELIAADRAFAAAGAPTDAVGALAAMFAPDVAAPAAGGTRFSTTAAEAIEALRSSPANNGARVQWTPVRGGVSADGLHGFTFGYMTMRAADGKE